MPPIRILKASAKNEDEKNGATEDKNQIHYLPCSINCDGPANIKQYFESYIKEDSDNVLRCSLRGRGLSGRRMRLPPGYSLTQLSHTRAGNLRASPLGDSLHLWNWDITPSSNDPFSKALDWIHIAEALHQPVEE